MTNNFALKGGVLVTSSSGSVQFYDSTLTDNFANSNPIAQLFDCVAESLFNHCQINNNTALSMAEIDQELKLN